MSKEKKVELCAAEVLEVAKDLMFCVISGDLAISSHRLGACLNTLERVQYRMMRDILGQADVLSLQDAKANITALREQIATMEGGLAKIINKQNDWEESYWTMRQKFLDYVAGALPHELAKVKGGLGPDRTPETPAEDPAL